MATYNKPLYSVAIKTLGGNEFTIADTSSSNSGSAALASIEAKADIRTEASGTITIIPYHAIDSAVVTVTSSSTERPEDANCPDESDEGEGG